MSKLARACELSLNDWFATFPEIIPEAERSEKHEKWKKKLFDKMRNDRYHRFTTRTVRVMLVAAVLWALLLTAFVIPSSREFIIDNFDIFSTYKLTESNDNSVNGEITVGYIPEGFELENKHINSNLVAYDYKSNEDIVITIMKCSSSIKIEFDTATGITEEIIIDDLKYLYYTDNNGICGIIWNKNDYVFRINGLVSKDELVKIATTVE